MYCDGEKDSMAQVPQKCQFDCVTSVQETDNLKELFTDVEVKPFVCPEMPSMSSLGIP